MAFRIYNDKVEAIVPSPKEVADRIKLEVEKAVATFLAANEALQKQLEEINAKLEETIVKTNKTIVPDYSQLGSDNKFKAPFTSWSSDADGFVLVTVQGICDFEVLVNGASLVSKLPESTSPLRSDVEVFFSQILQVRKNDVVEVKKKPTSLDAMVCSCRFIPNKLVDVLTL